VLDHICWNDARGLVHINDIWDRFVFKQKCSTMFESAWYWKQAKKKNFLVYVLFTFEIYSWYFGSRAYGTINFRTKDCRCIVNSSFESFWSNESTFNICAIGPWLSYLGEWTLNFKFYHFEKIIILYEE